jgi:hypothetical protein
MQHLHIVDSILQHDAADTKKNTCRCCLFMWMGTDFSGYASLHLPAFALCVL